MKFITPSKKLLALFAIFGLFFSLSINCLKKYESENKLENNAEILENLERNKRRSRSSLRNEANPPISNTTNYTIGLTFNSAVNGSASNIDLKTFVSMNKNSKFHLMFDKQIEEIFHIFRSKKMSGVDDFRSGYNLFITPFKNCDKDNDNLLNEKEFISCLSSDSYLSLIQAPDKLYTTNSNFTATPTSFGHNLFVLADNYDKGGLNFYDYVIMRLMAFAWRKCSVNSPFLDEASFECAIDIVSGSRSLHSNSLRRLFQLALELSNTKSTAVRTVDFIVYYAFASSVRLFGKINARENMDATQTEFNTALDINILPTRYNQEIITHLFRLVRSSSSTKSGIDLYSFCFYDHFLKLFYQGAGGDQRWKISLNELNKIVSYYLFPQFIINYMTQVPTANYTSDSFNLRAHINNNAIGEEDSMGKFLEVSSKIQISAGRYNNTSYYQPLVINRLFTMLDSNNDGFLSYYDFMNFIQTFYLYNQVDSRHADRVLIGDILTTFTTHSDTPIYSSEFRERSKRFSMLDQDLYIDPYYSLAITRMDDYVHHYLRKSDPTTVKEIELGLIFEKINLKNFPSGYISKCNRGKDENGIPKYDWECAITKAISRTLVYLEHSRDFKDIQAHGLNLTYTQIDAAGAN